MDRKSEVLGHLMQVKFVRWQARQMSIGNRIAMLLAHTSGVDGPYPGIIPFAKAALVPLLFSVVSHLWTTQRSPKAVSERSSVILRPQMCKRKVAQDVPFLLLVAGASTLAMMAYHTSQGSFLAACMAHMLLALPWLIAGGARLPWMFRPLPAVEINTARRHQNWSTDCCLYKNGGSLIF
eukprot:scaffold15850_cov12-Tisochrysis_lutea.AAC.1